MKFSAPLFSPKRFYFNKKNGVLGKSLYEVYDGNRISEDGLMWYLEMGYVPGRQTLFEGISKVRNYQEISVDQGELKTKKRIYLEDLIDPSQNDRKTKKEMIEEGGDIFNCAVEKILRENAKQVILPLTAGLDSRMILGGLLQNIPASKIITFTYGVPGSYDFEIGKKIAKKLGTKHFPLDLTSSYLTKEKLLKFAKFSDFSVPLFDHWPIDEVGEIIAEYDGSLWSGVLGSPLSGGNFPKSFGENVENIFMCRTNRLPSVSSLSAALLNKKPERSDFQPLYEELKEITHDTLDIYFRHLDLIAPTLLMPHFDNVQPFADLGVVSFYLSLPLEYRVNRLLMREIILHHYPQISHFPSNRNHGLPLNLDGVHKRILLKVNKVFKKKRSFSSGGKYLSLKWQFENQPEMRDLILSSLNRLGSRKLFHEANLNMIIREFLGRSYQKVDHSRVIDSLVSLELFLEFLEYKH